MAVAAAATLCMSAGQADAAIILQQPPKFSGAAAISDTFSIRAFEDFRLTAPATITDVQWWGRVTNNPNYNPASGPMAFTISFHFDDPTRGFFPNLTAFSEQVVSATAETGLPATNALHFTTHLNTPVDLPAGVDIWISILGHDLGLGGLYAPFSWAEAAEAAPNAPTPNFLAQKRNDRDEPQLGQLKVAFVLESNPLPVPEPGTLSLLGFGIAMIGLQGRRIRRANR